jgi:acyl-CoA reductase-like NAD-dependent aldehyde dehydrogenase
MSEQLLKQLIDAVTGESITVPFTDEEVAAHEAMQAAHQAQQAEQEAKVAARASALAKLAALGLTEAEVAAL